MTDDDPVDLTASATLKKWPSLNGRRMSPEDGAIPYTLLEAGVTECVRQLLRKPKTQHHLYEIHLGDGRVLSAADALEIKAQPDFSAK